MVQQHVYLTLIINTILSKQPVKVYQTWGVHQIWVKSDQRFYMNVETSRLIKDKKAAGIDLSAIKN